MKRTQIFLILSTWVVVYACSLNWSGRAAEKDGGFIIYPCTSEAPGPVVFSHRSHGVPGAGYACDKCHTSASFKTLNVTMDAIIQGQVCGVCHDGRTKEPRRDLPVASIQDCASCHMPPADIVIKLGRMDPVPFSHIRHLAVDITKKISTPVGFSCSSCHPTPIELGITNPIGMEVPHESGGCAQCHNGKKRIDGMPTAFAANTRCLVCHKP